MLIFFHKDGTVKGFEVKDFLVFVDDRDPSIKEYPVVSYTFPNNKTEYTALHSHKKLCYDGIVVWECSKDLN